MNNVITLLAIILSILVSVATIIQGVESFLNILERLRKNRIDHQPQESQNSKKPHLQITQSGIKEITSLALYVFIALIATPGIHQLSSKIDREWSSWLLDIAFIGTMFISPLIINDLKERKLDLRPMTIAWIIAMTYTMIGYLLLISPDLGDRNLLLFIFLAMLLIGGLQITFLLSFFKNNLDPWFKNLPK